jgi:hypothetical protein
MYIFALLKCNLFSKKINEMIWKGNSITHSTLDEGYDFIITDKWKKKYHFKISTFAVPSGFVSEAIEVIGDKKDNEPRIIHVLSDFESDTEKSELLLKAKIIRNINQRHLKFENGILQIGDEQQLRGNISWNDNLTDTVFNHVFAIDGKRITIEDFVKMIECYSGWNFQFKIYDISEDIE